MARPLGSAGADQGKKKKKKAADLVWYATSDLDRGVFRARSALIALLFGLGLTFWMLLQGDSRVLAGNQLTKVHEDNEFLSKAGAVGNDRCTACHVGAGKVSTLKCLDCHPYNRPLEGHVANEVMCVGCHIEHRGHAYSLTAAAVFGCIDCHDEPHEKLKRTKPKLVAGFDIEAPADVAFHLSHEAQGVNCLKCHAPAEHSAARGIRGACGQCHAPDHPMAGDCQQCHLAHPDRPRHTVTASAVTAIAPVARIEPRGPIYSLLLLTLSFMIAAILPRTRKVIVAPAEKT